MQTKFPERKKRSRQSGQKTDGTHKNQNVQWMGAHRPFRKEKQDQRTTPLSKLAYS